MKGDRLAWIGLAALAGLAYGPVLWRLSAAWWIDPEYSHGLLCAPLAAGIVWARRDRLARLSLAPSAAGLAGAAISIALLLIGTLGAEVFLTRASLLLFVASSIVFLFGWQHLRGVAFPFAILALSIPVPALLMTHVTLPLQFAASAAAEASLSAVHIPVLREGNVLVLPGATLQVAEACSGVRSMMSLLVLALLVARNMETRTLTRIAIVATAIPVTIAINAVRVTTTAIATEYYGVAAADGVIHEMLGVILFIASAILLVGCARLLMTVAPRWTRWSRWARWTLRPGA
jgi:exosortase